MTELAHNPLVSLGDLPLQDWQQGEFYRCADSSFGKMLGLKGLGISYNEVPAGKSGCPFHNHHQEEELFVILEGEGTYRFGDQKHPFKAGDVLGAPNGGQETAHQIINTGANLLKYLAIANNHDTEVCGYPDSGKFQVTSCTSENKRLRHCGREGENHIDYWDGEPGA